jgi:hypothetical protein
VSAIKKHAGRAFGACAVANAGCRNGLLRLALPTAPLDDTVRLQDAFGAWPKTELYDINQVRAERKINQVNQKKGVVTDTKQPTAETVPALSGLDFAIRCLMDKLPENILADVNTFAEVEQNGIPLKISGEDKLWYNLRQSAFTKKRKRNVACLDAYGGIANLNTHGSASKWKEMLVHLARSCVGVIEDATDDAPLRLAVKFSINGCTYLKRIQVAAEMYEWFVALGQRQNAAANALVQAACFLATSHPI